MLMENDVFFDVDSYMFSGTMGLTGLNVSQLQQKLINKIVKKAKEIKANKIITNANLASVIQDSRNYSFNPPMTNIKPGETYTMGQIDGVKIFVDPYIRWDDNYIHFENDDEKLIRKLKIKSVENIMTEEDKNRIGRIYSGLVKDTNGILI